MQLKLYTRYNSSSIQDKTLALYKIKLQLYTRYNSSSIQDKTQALYKIKLKLFLSSSSYPLHFIHNTAPALCNSQLLLSSPCSQNLVLLQVVIFVSAPTPAPTLTCALRIKYTKELSLWHKLLFSNPYNFASKFHRA